MHLSYPPGRDMVNRLVTSPHEGVRADFWFSRISRAVVSSCSVQHAVAEQIEPGTAIHAPLD